MIAACDQTHIKTAIQSYVSSSCYFAASASFRTRHRNVYNQQTGSSAAQRSLADFCYAKRHPDAPLETIDFPMEFGDKLVMTNAKGKKVLLISKQAMTIAHIYARFSGFFQNPHILRPEIEPLSASDVRQIAEEMFALGILSHRGKFGLLEGEKLAKVLNSASWIGTKNYRKIAIEQGLIPRFELSDEEVQSIRFDVEEFLSQRRLIRDRVQSTFGVEDVIEIPTPAYHLDVVMAPGPKGSVFLYDPNAVLTLLTKIQTCASQLSMSETDCRLLRRYQIGARQISRDLGALYEEVAKSLAAADLTVIRTPGIFYDEHDPYPPNSSIIHFMNPLTGWSPKTSAYYYITTGASIGDQLGQLLMDAYAQFLQMHGPGMHVYFVGRDPQNALDFSQAMRSHDIRSAGIHCYSFPLKTASHSDDETDFKSNT